MVSDHVTQKQKMSQIDYKESDLLAMIQESCNNIEDETENSTIGTMLEIIYQYWQRF